MADDQTRVAGWVHTSIITGDGWMALAICPQCRALVLADTRHALDHTRQHEQWHARMGHPIGAPSSNVDSACKP